MADLAMRLLRGVVGDDHLTPAGESLCVRPGRVEQLAEVVALAHREGWRIRPAGAGTRQPAGGQRDRSTAGLIVVETTRLARILEHEAGDLVAAVECGVRFADLQRELAGRRQRVPLDPPLERAGSTVGGVLATDAFGPLRLRFGSARERVIGATLVRFDGRIVRTGGMVVKNVSGYDLSKLYVGSWGSLGVLVRANFKLDPLPRDSGLLDVKPPDGAAAGRVVARALREPVTLCSAVLARGEPALREPAAPLRPRLLLGLEGLPGTLESQAETVAELARGEGCRDFDWLSGDRAAAMRERVAEARLPAAHPVRVRLSYPPAAYDALIARAGRVVGEDAPAELTFVGSGISWLGLSDAGPTELLVQRLRSLRRLCAERHGWMRVERMPDACAEHVAAWQLRPAERRLMLELKTALDPQGTFPSPPYLDGAAGDGTA